MNYTVDELALAANTMTTTVRMYQNKGVLHPPAKKGRVGIYDNSHLDRIQLIIELQRRGHSLAGIADLLHSYEQGESLADLLGLSALRQPTPVKVPLVDSASLDEVTNTVDKLAGLAREATVTALEQSLRRDVERFADGPDPSA